MTIATKFCKNVSSLNHNHFVFFMIFKSRISTDVNTLQRCELRASSVTRIRRVNVYTAASGCRSYRDFGNARTRKSHGHEAPYRQDAILSPARRLHLGAAALPLQSSRRARPIGSGIVVSNVDWEDALSALPCALAARKAVIIGTFAMLKWASFVMIS